MKESSNWLVHDHQKYEAILNDCEMAAGAGEWKDAIRLFKNFVTDIQLHMRMEDEVLYPLFQEEHGDPHGAIADLSDEHEDLIRLIQDLAYVIKTNDLDHFEESLIPLHKAMTRHNDHEETVFLSLGSESLLMRRDEILQRLNAVQAADERHSWKF